MSSESFASVFGRRPQLFADYRAFEESVRGALDPRLFELCRARVARILGGDAEEVAARTDCERACLRLADRFVLDPHGVSDADAAEVAAHLSPAAMVALIEALALFDGFMRFRLILGVED
jgi:hypothetical protein